MFGAIEATSLHMMTQRTCFKSKSMHERGPSFPFFASCKKENGCVTPSIVIDIFDRVLAYNSAGVSTRAATTGAAFASAAIAALRSEIDFTTGTASLDFPAFGFHRPATEKDALLPDADAPDADADESSADIWLYR